MCLLDEVVEWDAQHIVCRSATHRNGDNPLRAHGRLNSICGIEYAAQAMAVHGALLAPLNDAANRTPRPKAGYLTSLRSVRLHRERLDDCATDLFAGAQRLGGDERSILYGFTLNDGVSTLIEGRATVILDARNS
jgi:predicted hotdog family 3-hydroxylacyl-ACP dehydratase